MTIETPRLLLRLPVPADAQALMEIHTDPHVLAEGLVTLTIDGRANIDHVISLIRATDARSMKVAEKAGQRFEREGVEPISGENRNVFGIYRRQSR